MIKQTLYMQVQYRKQIKRYLLRQYLHLHKHLFNRSACQRGVRSWHLIHKLNYKLLKSD